jgi:hypothetical protein
MYKNISTRVLVLDPNEASISAQIIAGVTNSVMRSRMYEDIQRALDLAENIVTPLAHMLIDGIFNLDLGWLAGNILR